jgi:cytochrome c peroxidase
MLKLRASILSVLLLSTATVVGAETGPPTVLPNLFPFPNPHGILKTFNESGKLDLTGPFFQSLGTNGRSCATCHQASDAWSVSAAHVAERFEETKGLDPIFRTNDGSNCDQHINTTTVEGRRQAYSLLINRGLIRIALAVPTGAEFEVVSVSNPYKCNDTSTLSMYRRPLPSTNLRFLTTVMWDGRESSAVNGFGTIPITPSGNNTPSGKNPDDLQTDLRHQSLDATNGHAQGSSPISGTQQKQIVNFEMGLSTAQAVDSGAGSLESQGAHGGPVALSNQFFFVGINDPLGQNPRGTAFNPVIFTLFTPTWADEQFHNKNRASILRGQTLFNSHPIAITGVAGINDALGVDTLSGTCGTCHDSPNVGNHSVIAPLNIGLADVGNKLNPLGVDYLPVIKLRQKADHTKEISTTDPGRALVTGKWADIGKFKGPILRGLSARAPYFHNGSAESLKDVVEFYNVRFGMGLTEREQADLAAFLSTL